jgi:hypothetical protein
MKRLKRDEWAERVRRWKASGQTAAEFAGREGVRAKTLQHWGWRLGRERGVAAKRQLARADFIEVMSPRIVQSLAAPVSSASVRAFEVTLPGGARIVVPPSFDREAMAELVRLLGAA